MALLKRMVLSLLLVGSVLAGTLPAGAQDEADNPWYRPTPQGDVEISLHFFYSATCSYCAEAERFLPGMLLRRPWLKLESYEVDNSPENRELFADFAAALDEEILGVPTFFLCGQMIVGFDENTGALLAAVADYCHDLLAQDLQAPQATPPAARASGNAGPDGVPAAPGNAGCGDAVAAAAGDRRDLHRHPGPAYARRA